MLGNRRFQASSGHVAKEYLRTLVSSSRAFLPDHSGHSLLEIFHPEGSRATRAPFAGGASDVSVIVVMKEQ